MPAGLPLATTLSQLLVAFTIELDNAFEVRMPHWTTSGHRDGGKRQGVWLTSLVMYLNLVQYTKPEGISVADLQQQSRIAKLQLPGMTRWGYITVNLPEAASSNPRITRRSLIVRLTPRGEHAKSLWRLLLSEIEDRWNERFGQETVTLLKSNLSGLLAAIDSPQQLPDYLPVVGYGLSSREPLLKHAPSQPTTTCFSSAPLPVLLSQLLLACALTYEEHSTVSLAISANVLRVLGDEALANRDLPALTGTSKEAVAFAIGFLKKKDMLREERNKSGSRDLHLRLTRKGMLAQAEYLTLLRRIEQQWAKLCEQKTLMGFQQSLEAVAEPQSRLLDCVVAPPDGWRTRLPRSTVLPHFPVILHRGGYPDGS